MTGLDHGLHEGHRDRLRRLFANSPSAVSETELLELLLTYALPRVDVAPIAAGLLECFGNLENVFSAPVDELKQIKGLGESAVLFLKIIQEVIYKMTGKSSQTNQPSLFPSDEVPAPENLKEVRTFGNDEILNTLHYLPFAGNFDKFSGYKAYLQNNLPYNSVETRERRTAYILDRFYPDDTLETALTSFTRYCSNPEALKPVVFYQIARAEKLLAKVAEDIIYPALPMGRLGRGALKEYISSLLSELRSATLEKSIRSITNSYELLGVGRVDKEQIKIQLRPGNLEAFVYILTSEYPLPGIYSFDSLFEGPAHRWLLWGKDWIRKQLYGLRDMGVISKVSEIDTVRQFSLEFGQREELALYFKLAGLSLKIGNPGGDEGNEI